MRLQEILLAAAFASVGMLHGCSTQGTNPNGKKSGVRSSESSSLSHRGSRRQRRSRGDDSASGSSSRSRGSEIGPRTPPGGRRPAKCDHEVEAMIGGCIFNYDHTDEVCHTHGYTVAQDGNRAAWIISRADKTAAKQAEFSSFAIYAQGDVTILLDGAEVLVTHFEINGRLIIKPDNTCGDTGKVRDGAADPILGESWVAKGIAAKEHCSFKNYDKALPQWKNSDPEFYRKSSDE